MRDPKENQSFRLSGVWIMAALQSPERQLCPLPQISRMIRTLLMTLMCHLRATRIRHHSPWRGFLCQNTYAEPVIVPTKEDLLPYCRRDQALGVRALELGPELALELAKHGFQSRKTVSYTHLRAHETRHDL